MHSAILHRGFVYETASFPSCHASTLLEVPDGILVAFFGGTRERNPDVCIYTARWDGRQWAPPVEVADGIQPDGSRWPCWNPVLFQPKGGPIMLFYKVGPSPSEWWGMVKTSADGGRTWSAAERLPEGILGPIKNKAVQLDNGDILSPTSFEDDGIGWRVYFERSRDGGRTWQATPWGDHPDGMNAIQPSILIHGGGHLQAIGRTRKHGIFQTHSRDNGLTWSRLEPTGLPNPNSGTDAVTLRDGRHLLVYNDSDTPKVRFPLSVAVSADGQRWEKVLDLETEPPGEYSYPAVIQASDGRVHVSYTWKRLRVSHVVLDPQRL